ncbi:MAG: hypothetical protein ACI361_03720 [Atopobiaceae bacterium]
MNDLETQLARPLPKIPADMERTLEHPGSIVLTPFGFCARD